MALCYTLDMGPGLEHGQDTDPGLEHGKFDAQVYGHEGKAKYLKAVGYLKVVFHRRITSPEIQWRQVVVLGGILEEEVHGHIKPGGGHGHSRCTVFFSNW